MPGIFLTQRFSSGESRRDYLVENDEETIESINWYLYNSDGGEGAITVKRECDPSRETGHHAAILSVQSDWAISLVIVSQIYMHAHGWRPNHHSDIHLTKSSLTPKSTSRVFLRPDDVFQIGHVILKIQRDAPHIPEPGFGTATTALRVNDISQKRKRTDDQSQDDMGIKTREAVMRSSAGPQSAHLQQHNKVTGKMQVGEKTPPELLKASPGIPPSIESTSLVLREARLTSRNNTPVRVFADTLSLLGKSKNLISTFKKLGLHRVDSIKECDIICIPKSEFKITPTLVLAAISGKQIVFDDWLAHTVIHDELLDHEFFLARDPSKEREWGIDLSEAIERGKRGVKPLLNYVFYFTEATAKYYGTAFSNLKNVALAAGAGNIEPNLPKVLSRSMLRWLVHIGLAPNDEKLEDMVEAGWKFYTPDILLKNALRGFVDLDSDEFILRPRGSCRVCGAIKKRGNVEYRRRN